MAEVFGVADGAYRRDNAFWSARSVMELAEATADPLPLRARAERIRARYADLSAQYQATKGANSIPLA